MSIGIPVKLLHEAAGHVVTVRARGRGGGAGVAGSRGGRLGGCAAPHALQTRRLLRAAWDGGAAHSSTRVSRTQRLYRGRGLGGDTLLAPP